MYTNSSQQKSQQYICHLIYRLASVLSDCDCRLSGCLGICEIDIYSADGDFGCCFLFDL